jgi:hypothetical protein
VFGGLEEMGAPLGALGCLRGEVVMDVFLSLLLLLFFAVSCCDYVNCLRRLLLRKQLCSVGGGGALVVVEDKSGETEPPRKTLFSFSLLFLFSLVSSPAKNKYFGAEANFIISPGPVTKVTLSAVRKPTAKRIAPANMGASRWRPSAEFIAANTGIPIPAINIVIA